MKTRSLLLKEYSNRKKDIGQRLKEFKKLKAADDNKLFEELCFCLLTPQSKAVSCAKAIESLKKSDLILRGTSQKIKPVLRRFTRFHNKKAEFIVEARRALGNGKRIDIKSKIERYGAFRFRDWLVDNIKGLGYKEASHFLRNVGFGQGIAILDRHILKNLEAYGAILKRPGSIGTRKYYLEIEDKVKNFCELVKIPPEELDLLFWSMETGHIFK